MWFQLLYTYCLNELHLYMSHCISVVLVGVYGVGARQERGLLERHDNHHRGRDQQTEKTRGFWERTGYIIVSHCHHKVVIPLCPV